MAIDLQRASLRARRRKVIFFLLIVMVLTTIYQVIAYQVLLPNRPIVWRVADVSLMGEMVDRGARLAMLVMLEEDTRPEVPHQLAVFDDPAVRAELNRLRLRQMLIRIDPQRDTDRDWLAGQTIQKLPMLILHAQSYDEPIVLQGDDLEPERLAKVLEDVRFRRYAP